MPKPPDGKKYEKKYTEDDITNAVAAIKNGMPKKEAARKFQIPRATLQFRIANNDINPRPGPPTVLSNTEEKTLVEWIISCSKKGFPRRKEDIMYSVEQFLTKAPRPNVFINNKPGEGWYKLFMKRNPNIVSRTAEAVTSASANVSEENIRKWFNQIEDALKQEDLFEILDDPSRVFNGDETGFQLCPKQGKVLAEKGTRDVYEIDMAQAKSSITVMFTFSAGGVITPPLIIYPLKRMRAEIRDSVPEHWGLALSDNGWMTKDIFYQYILNVLHPYLEKENVVFPIILFLDGHKSHINYELSLKCKELGIVLIALYPNATRILQPADVAAFKPMKDGWKKALLEWRRNNVTKQLTKVDFGGILQTVLAKFIKKETIQNGFRACGLQPWNPDVINFTKCLGSQKAQCHMTTPHKQVTLTLMDFQKIVGADIVNRLESTEPKPEQHDCFRKALGNIYKFFKNESNATKHTDPQETDQENLLVGDTWFPIDEIPITVCENQEIDTSQEHTLNDQNDNFKTPGTTISFGTNNTKQVSCETKITLPMSENKPIALADVNQETEKRNTLSPNLDFSLKDSDHIIQLYDDVEKLQINLMKELQNQTNPTYEQTEKKDINDFKSTQTRCNEENKENKAVPKLDTNDSAQFMENTNSEFDLLTMFSENVIYDHNYCTDLKNIEAEMFKQPSPPSTKQPENQLVTKSSNTFKEFVDHQKTTQEALDLKNCLDWPPTPKRKGKKTNAEPLYVLTATKWLETEEMKRKEKEKIMNEKEQRKKIKEEAKQAKLEQQVNKKMLKDKNIRNKIIKKDTVTAEKHTKSVNECNRKRKSGIETNIYIKKKKIDIKTDKNNTLEIEDVSKEYKKQTVNDSNVPIKSDNSKTEYNTNDDNNTLSCEKKFKILSVVHFPKGSDFVKRKLFQDHAKPNNNKNPRQLLKRRYLNEKEIEDATNEQSD